MQKIIPKEIHIVGVSTITSNDVAYHEIGKLWEQFFNNAVKEKLTEIASPNIFCVYSDYENGTQGKYKVTIGYAVSNLSQIPHDLSSVTIVAGHYKSFKAESRAVEHIVATWQTIWAIDEKTLPRNFIADFEEYSDNELVINIGYSQ